PGDFDPHKPYIDSYTWKCRDCSGTMRRVPEVIDAWFDSGSMPYAQWHYPFDHQADFKAHFPADYICEGVDQTRGWFYSLLAIGVTAFDAAVYKHVIVNDMVLDEHGLKMSKSRGNVVDPMKAVAEHGADAVRLYLVAQSQVWLPKRFDERQIPEIAGGFLNTLRSTYDFFRRYAEDWNPPAAENATPAAQRPAADRWLLAGLDEVVLTVRQPLARMQVAVPAAGQGPALSDLLDILAAEVNVKDVQVVASDHDLVRLRGKANFRTLGKRYGKETPRAAAAVAELGAAELQALEQGTAVQFGEWEFRAAEVTV